MAQELIRLPAQPHREAGTWDVLDEVRELRDQSDEQHRRQLFADYLLWQEIKRLQQQIVVLTHHVARQQTSSIVRGVQNELGGTRYLGFHCAGCGLMVWTTIERGNWRSVCPKCQTPCVYPVEPPNV